MGFQGGNLRILYSNVLEGCDHHVDIIYIYIQCILEKKDILMIDVDLPHSKEHQCHHLAPIPPSASRYA